MTILYRRALVVGTVVAMLVFQLGWTLAGGSDWGPLRDWRPYMTVGYDICDAHWSLRSDGVEEGLDRHEILGKGPWYATKLKYRRLQSPEAVLKIAHRMCGELGAEADVRVEARCADGRGGWVTHYDREENACRLPKGPVPSKSGAGQRNAL